MGFVTRVPPVLLFGMSAWTLLTIGIGWYALQGTSRASGHAVHGRTTPVATRPVAYAAETTPTAAVVADGTRTGTPQAERTRIIIGTVVGSTVTATATSPTTAVPEGTATVRTGATTTGGARTRVPARTATPGGTVGPGATATAPGGSGGDPSTTPTAVPTFTPTARPRPTQPPTATVTPAPYPVPRYAQSAGIEGGAASAGNGGSTPLIRDMVNSPNRGVVVLDPGHGRGDPGAVHYAPDGTPDVLEAEMSLRNAMLLRKELLALGYDVYLTRDGPGRGPDGPLVQQFISSDLVWRTQLATAVEADLYLALHGNGATVKSISGPETWYCGQHEQAAANAKFAAMIQQAMMDALHEYGYFPPNRGIMEDATRHHSGDFCQFVVTRETSMPSALLEFLFLSNDDDARVLADHRSQEILAVHLADAIHRFMSERP